MCVGKVELLFWSLLLILVLDLWIVWNGKWDMKRNGC